jgi:hypothetical protein
MKNPCMVLAFLFAFSMASPTAHAEPSLLDAAGGAEKATMGEVAPAEVLAPAVAVVEAVVAVEAVAADSTEKGSPAELDESSAVGEMIGALMGAIGAGGAGDWALMGAFLIFLMVGILKKYIWKQEDGSGYVKVSGPWNVVVAIATGVILAIGAFLTSGTVTLAGVLAAGLAGGVNGLAAAGLYDATQLVKKKETVSESF